MLHLDAERAAFVSELVSLSVELIPDGWFARVLLAGFDKDLLPIV